MIEKINLIEHFNDKISSRTAVEFLFNKLIDTNAQKVVIDFSGITHISRSAAHQFNREAEAFRKNAYSTLEFQGMHENIKEMMQLARNSAKRPYFSFNTFEFDNLDDFYEYLDNLNV